MFPPVDTKDAPAVAAYVTLVFGQMFASRQPDLLARVFHDVDALFAGRHPDYAAIDLRYHDLEHTLQATVCIAQLLRGRAATGVEPRLTPRQFELAIIATLLHDAGYLKLRSDTTGTGAKYTYCHVLRSCAFAASYLPLLGASNVEVEAVLAAISCTGPTKEISRLRFREPVDRTIGSAVATADYLAQMAAPDYPDELEILFQEFQESDDFIHLAPENRVYRSARELIERTSGFWRNWVLPKLETDFERVYLFLATPFPFGPNPYVAAIERNLQIIGERAKLVPGASP